MYVALLFYPLAGLDYNSTTEIVSIPTSGELGALGCTSIYIINDDLVEEDEIFRVLLVVEDLNVVVPDAAVFSAAIHIIDDDVVG